MRTSALLTAAAIAAAPLLAPLSAHAAVGPGSLVKLVSDRDPSTSVDAAVYVLGGDGKRYVFPNEATYRSWYADFAGVQELSAGELAAISIGGNVTVRPGTRLVKITTDPKVYAVEPGGVLRAIPDEATARALFGDAWAQRVDDVPDAFFVNYVLGAPLVAGGGEYPAGSILRTESTGERYLVDAGALRPLSEESFVALRASSSVIRPLPSAVLLTTGQGLPVQVDEAAGYADPTFVGARMVVTPAVSAPQAGTAADLLMLTIAAPQALRVEQVGIRLLSPSDTAAVTPDTDNGGLVRGAGERGNITALELRTSAGAIADAELALSPALDGAQALAFVPAQPLVVAAGRSVQLRVRGTFAADLAAGQAFRAELDPATTRVIDVRTGQPVQLRVLSGLSGNELTVSRPGLAMRALPVPRATFVRGAAQAEVARFALSASGAQTFVVRELAFQGYVDKQEGTNAFSRGKDASGAVQTRARDLVDALTLVEVGTGRVLVPAAGLTDDGRVVFSALSLRVAPGASEVQVALVGQIDQDVDLEDRPDRLAFDLEDGRVDISAFSEAGARLTVDTVQLPNGGNTPGQFITIRGFGATVFAWRGVSATAARGSEVLVGTLEATSRFDGHTLNSFVVRDGAALAGFSAFRATYRTAAGATQSASGFRSGDRVIFSGLSVDLALDTAVTIEVYATVDANAVAGSAVAVSFAPETGLSLVPRTTQFEVVQPNLENGGVTVSRNDASNVLFQ